MTMQAIADSIGVTVPAQLANFLEKHSRKYISAFIRRAYAFSQTSKSFALRKVHLEMALESRGEQRLYGYDAVPEYSANRVTVDGVDVFAAVEREMPQDEGVLERSGQSAVGNERRCQWTLVEGIYTGDLYSNSYAAESSRSLRHIERSLSVPVTYQKSSYEYYQDKVVFANDVLCREYQKFFLSFINLLRYDNAYTIENALNRIVDENKLQPIVPYFLQFIFGKITALLNEPKEMVILIRFALALGLNKSVNLGIYVHSFLKIAFTGLTSLSFNDSLGDYEVSIRDYSAELLKVICDRCQYYFKDMKTVIFNALVNVLFDIRLTLNSHYGALVGIMSLGDEFSNRLIPHLDSYLHIVKGEESLFYSNPISHEIESKIKQLRSPFKKPIQFYYKTN